jgi:hypothetical protein
LAGYNQGYVTYEQTEEKIKQKTAAMIAEETPKKSYLH